MFLTKESSPFNGSSPFNNSPRLFWKEQTISPKNRFDSENEFEHSSPTLSPKRNSIENLKKQSRVKNSSMFAREQQHEYDPSAVQPLDRPLAAGRPLSTAVQGNAFNGNGLSGFRDSIGSPMGHRRGESLSKIPTLSPSKTSPAKLQSQSAFSSPSKETTTPPEGRASPTKSSLVTNGRFNSPKYNPDASIMSDDDDFKHQTLRPLRRHAKSVTFDTAPPTITEYEMVTPDPSAASGSREGSYESESEEEELSFDVDDSFDASLEDTEKTPVVLPEDWRHMSPDAANTSLTDLYDDVFDARDNSPMPTARPNGAMNAGRHGSTNSDNESRPLPPLPGLQGHDDRRRRDSSIGLSAAAERASESRRSLPQLPQAAGISKSDLLNMREASMSLEDRLRLMNFDDERDVSTPTQESHDKKAEQDVQVHVAEVEDATEEETEVAVNEPKVPRISRESILRRVKSRNFEDDYADNYDYDPESSPERSYGDLADLDPDVPIPSRECSSNFDENPAGVAESEADSVIDAYSFGETMEADNTEISQLEDYERESSVVRHPVKHEPQEDEVSEYSPQPEEQPTSQSTIDSSGPPTPTAATASPTATEKQARQEEMFSSFEGDKMDLSLDPLKASFATAPSPLDTAPKMDAMREFLRRPATPETIDDAGTESDAPGTPESVIRHPVASPPPEEEEDHSPEVPQREATIRGAGGRLKTRPSLIPDEVDMAATRRKVSGGHPPPVPERSPKRQSLTFEIGHVDDDTQLSISNKENLMLDLEFGEDSNDLSFGLDKEFNHIIEAQKVNSLFPLPSFAQFPTSAVARQYVPADTTDDGFVYMYHPANESFPEQKGYLMRENTKVVVASSRQFSDEKPPVDEKSATEKSAKSSPRKSSGERKPAWTTEPWNGKARRKSIRTTSGRRVPTATGPAPPLPGQESAVSGGLDSVAEQGDEEFEDGEERGRVFVKVVGVKDLDLPLPKSKSPLILSWTHALINVQLNAPGSNLRLTMACTVLQHRGWSLDNLLLLARSLSLLFWTILNSSSLCKQSLSLQRPLK